MFTSLLFHCQILRTSNDSGQIVHKCAYITKQYNVVLDESSDAPRMGR